MPIVLVLLAILFYEEVVFLVAADPTRSWGAKLRPATLAEAHTPCAALFPVNC